MLVAIQWAFPSGGKKANCPKTGMFERYTVKSLRVIFFARYEANNRGCRYIGTEHLLLGLLREEAAWFPGGCDLELEIRADIESRITRAERTSWKAYGLTPVLIRRIRIRT